MMRHFFVGYKNSLNKRLIAFLIILPFVVLLITIFQSLFFYWLNNKGITSDFYVHYEDIGINLLYSLIIVFFLELLHYFRNWNKAVAESAMLKQKSMEAQLEALKSQINPHFLFNSLNSLTSLIQIDGLQAINYVHKLSSVYRYMLHSNDKNLIKLEEELNFLQAYLHLLQIRFGTAFNYSIIIDAAYQGYFIPPLTLQLLVENAVKHNIVSTNLPLKVEISIAKGKLEVKNNLQKRTTPIISHQMGLVNLVTRYSFVTNDEIEIVETNVAFVVSLPLIKSSLYEGIDH